MGNEERIGGGRGLEDEDEDEDREETPHILQIVIHPRREYSVFPCHHVSKLKINTIINDISTYNRYFDYKENYYRNDVRLKKIRLLF